MNQREISETIAQMSKPIKWVIPDFIRTDHATHLLVQQQGSEFTLLFFEVQTPILTGTPEEQLTVLQEIAFAEAKCVSRIVLSIENMPLVVTNLIEAWNRFNEMLLATTKGQENAESSNPREISTAP